MTHMTIGVDTEYYLPSEREPKNFLELSDELLAIIEMARVQVADADDFAAMRTVVGTLNDVMHRDGLLGRTARLSADFSVVLNQELRYEGDFADAFQNPDVVTSSRHEGVFTGFDIAPFNGTTPELAYRLELPFTTKGLQFRTALAAVDSSDLAVEVAPFATMEDDDDLREPLALLTRIDDELVRKNLNLMIDLMDESEEVNADFLKETALLATEMLTRPALIESKEARDAVALIFASFVDGGAYYTFEGVDFGVTLMDKERRIDVREIEALGRIHGVMTVEDFEYTPSTHETEATFTSNKTMQPAFVFLDDSNVEHVVPIRYLKVFCMAEYSPSDSGCDAARNRFMEEYPDVFDKRKRYKLDSYIVEKYFQKDDGGV